MNSISEIIQSWSIIERMLAFFLLAPIAGGVLAGIDRKLSARLQGRYGPPVRQPFFDVLKLFQKERILVNKFQNFPIVLFFLFTVFSGALFFSGASILLAIFSLALAGTFFILGGFSVSSPYSHLGAERELIQMMSYEPMVILVAVGMYQVTGSFTVADIVQHQASLILYLPGVFAGFVYILTIKFRKSPFDLSMSHHAHQELVRGITTEFSGPALGLIEITHWYENVLLLGMVYLFFAFNPWLAIVASLGTYLFEIIIDMNYARFKWQLTFWSSWLFTAVAGVSNIIVLCFLK
ncbi:MAG: NADH-quinone oxidoreductase subunit H [Thermodesulfobacteriota bacterium]|jgi:formate hydrogenlyase subunit 4|nr:MAG: NADH-quinone oxidoreductase subunit H [Thermodesulfobacteriota bacterium]